MAEALDDGRVGINQGSDANPAAPFGGVKHSGFGREGGFEGIEEYLETKYVGDEIHPGETVEEKISLSERFGLWISFYPFSQDDYLDIVRHWLRHFGVSAAKIAGCERDALNWALDRGSRSGRVAWQFARDIAGHGNSARKRSK